MRKIIHLIIALACIFSLATAQSIELFETNQRFHPKIGKNAAVASQEEHASRIGLEVLKNGGNAVDAAVAIGYALAVTLPRAGNLGGGGFMTIWDNKEKKSYVINYREKAPSKINLAKINKLPRTDFANSFKAAGVPGTVAGLNLANKLFGKTTIDKLIAPAINLAENGFKINESQIESFDFGKNKLLQDSNAKRIFYKPIIDNSKKIISYNRYDKNEILKQPELAQTLKLIAKKGNAGFYQGVTADNIVKAMVENGGYISKNDLSNYQATLVEPVTITYRGYKIITPPPPSSGGVTIAQILNILELINIKSVTPFSSEYYHYLIEAFNLAYKNRNYKLGDPLFVENNIDKYINKDYAKKLANLVNTQKHTPAAEIDSNLKIWQEGDNTTHFVVIDKDSNIVSNTYTINYSFGSGKMIPKAGFFMNNELDDFTLVLGKPNAYGLIQGKKNLLEPNKQPLSSMTPLIVVDAENNPYLATGSPGGSKIITTVIHVLLNTINNRYNIKSAVSAPRIHSQLWPDKLYYEDGLSPDTLDKLKSMGHNLEQTKAIGSAQSLQLVQDYITVAEDPRRAGSYADAF